MSRDLAFIIPAIIACQLPLPLYITWGEILEYPKVFVPHGLRNLGLVPNGREIEYLHSLKGIVAFSPWIRTIDEKTKIQKFLPRHPRYQIPSLNSDSDTLSPLATVQSDPPASQFSNEFDAPSALSATTYPFPPVEQNSGQQEGEYMEAFFHRRQQNSTKRAAEESADQRHRREQKEENAAKGCAPGRKGARVFVWEETDGYYIRRAAGRSNYDDLWEEYGPDQRRYNSHYDEWDLCEKFGDPRDDDDDEEDHSCYADTMRVPSIAATFQDMVYLRFGCIVTEDIGDSSLSLPPPALVKKLLGNPEIVAKDNEMESFRLFLAHSKQAKSMYDIPRPLLDFHQPESDLRSNWVVQVHRDVLNGQMHYIISIEHPEYWRDLSILVKSATTALEIVRQGWGPSLRDVMEQLVARGIPFMTGRRSDYIFQISSIRPRYSGLGYRACGYKPDLIDYNTYVALRRAFLRSPRGRAALLYGGIVGRLARSEVDLDEIFRGPSDDAFINGICLWDCRSSFAYWDDCLSDQELDLICGVYHIATGQ
ncbi:hypothetical protein B0H17DRAFT_917418 [Mycena rosella]|uniref:Uncharacterized protein n=1 Tax=Mycena rosella TaxID=1033263 RepID=A0AAD7MAV9_MYCRO|nr:hypothetical protein B0H17DRAFT_917418 [Mycena rosella]